MRGPLRIIGLGSIAVLLGIIANKRKARTAEGEWRDVSRERPPEPRP